MPIKLSELATKSRKLSVGFDDETIEVTYLPGRMTMDMQTRVQEAMAKPAGEANSDLAEILSVLVSGWDVLDDKGEPLPVTVDLVHQMPLRFVTALTRSLFDDINPNAKTASS